MLTTLIEASAYGVGERALTVCSISQPALLEALAAAGYDPDSIELEYVPEPNAHYLFEEFTMVTARKSA